MKKYIKRGLLALGLLIMIGLCWLVYQASHRPSLEPYANRFLATEVGTATELRVTFLGVSTLLFDDGETAILFDGFFTRPSRKNVFTGKIAPDPELIAKSLYRAGIKHLAAVIVSHSHYDHVMDSPEVAKRTGALVVGSESTANVARGWGLAEDHIRVINDGDEIIFGNYKFTFVRSEHAPTPMTGGEIRKPLIPPVRAYQYEEGGSFSVLIKHKNKTLLVQSSAGYVASALRGSYADVVFLGIGALGKQNTAFRHDYWQEVVRAVGAKRVIPVHWDDFTLPLDQPLLPIPFPFDDFEKSMAFILEQGQREGVDIKLAPVWTKFDPFKGL